MHSIVLRYVIEVARQGSIRKAGPVLNVASSAVNRQIIKLEEELGVRLFDRLPDGVVLTAAGKLLVDHANRTLQEYEKLRPQIANVRDLQAGNIAISSIDSLNMSLVPEIIRRYRAEYPNISLTIRQDPANEVVHAVEEGLADIGLTFTCFERNSVRPVKDIRSPFGVLLNSGHPLAGNPSVSLDDIASHPSVKHYHPTGQNMFLDEVLTRERIRLDSVVFTNSMYVAKMLVENGTALGIYIKYGFWDLIKTGRVVFLPLDNETMSSYRIAAFIPSNRFINAAEQAFVKIASQVLDEYEGG
jgi:DNA-binding transcriptional LysR family regulator